MIIKMEYPDPKSKVVEFKREKRVGSLVPLQARYGSCRHERATIIESSRSVECSACKCPLDAFTVLYELAHKQRRWLEDLDAWDAHRDSMLSERYDQEWQQRVGDVIDPPTNPADRRIWDVFHEYMGAKFCGMYKRKQRKRNGPGWYGRSVDGACVSYEYARSRLVEKVSGKPVSAS